jgi:iron complex outermembrane recepter protein
MKISFMHKSVLTSSFILVFLLISTLAWSQNATIKGRVTTTDGKAAEFVNIILKGMKSPISNLETIHYKQVLWD